MGLGCSHGLQLGKMASVKGGRCDRQRSGGGRRRRAHSVQMLAWERTGASGEESLVGAAVEVEAEVEAEAEAEAEAVQAAKKEK